MNLRKIVKKFIPANLFPAVEPYGHLAEAVLLNTVSGFPGKSLKVIGVTGTNGKTSTSFLIHRMLHEAGYKVGLMSTVGYGVGADIQPQIHHMTNVSVPELMQRLKWMKNQGVEWLVLETTSHALAQNRVWGIPYSIAVMTNVTHEHLDYHKTFERYRDAKRMLFKLANKNKRGLQVGIINAEDPSAELFASDIKNPVLYGVGKGDVRATDVVTAPSGITYRAQASGDEYDIRCNLPGTFNVYNSLAAVCVGRAVGLTKEQIERGIAALEGVEGRMTRIDESQDFDVIVDFAHTPDSFEKLFKDLKPVVKGKLICMFGSAGRRDEAKRAVQGELAGLYCDEVVVTEEDDRDVDGVEIMDQIAGGAEKAGKVREQNLFLVHDRAQAINYAVSRASKGDTVLLLGKGHEKTIERANGENPWDEIGTARAALKKRA
ncbi:MAG TPA: UDP-N-acetylmuramoyl-L-alanyl-D-glutamate--2,6-diaminopimelate ligase [Candidatus Saccharimonadales bacterium]|nr:UDP-N-acetylmuramoyl-L-alanyl-D-glutamate--2,6-diaminopimelate ligase [Candidatus Saccharimonadales bacterium]